MLAAPPAAPIRSLVPDAAPLTFREHAAAWFAREAPKMKRGTRAVYATVHHDLIDVFGDDLLADLTHVELQLGLDLLEDRGHSPSTLARYRAVLSRIFRFARRRGHVARNPVADVDPVPQRGVRTIVVPTAEQLARVMDVVRTTTSVDRQMLFEILDATAIRIGECQVLRPNDYDGDRRRLRVGRTIFRGKLAPGEDREDTPKGNAERWVDVPDSLAASLPGFLATRRESDWCFPGRFGDQPITYAPLREEMVRIAEKAGVPGMTVHSFRHARLSLWIANGADLEWVRRQAGHHSIAFTIKRYGHHMPMRRQAVLRDLPGVDVRPDEPPP